MADKSTSLYKPLPTPTSIRVLILAPGQPDDEIFCWLFPADLEADHDRFPDSTTRPLKSMSFAQVTTKDGSTRQFMISFDIEGSNHGEGAKNHRFQRYSALSYVWGDPSDQKYITLDGCQFPVTQNLYAALRAIRKKHTGKRLWVDALCINQADHEEKRIQIGLMKRVYEQAKRVIAYVPLQEQDGENIRELIDKVWAAYKLLTDEAAGQGGGNIAEAEESAAASTGGSSKEQSLEIVGEKNDDGEMRVYRAFIQNPGKDKFIEHFGLPAIDSPLWISWRRFFASPYFQRIWILQEFISAKEVRFLFGTTFLRAEAVIAACHTIKMHTGSTNREYMQRQGEELALSGQSFRGLRRAWIMFDKRLLWKAHPANLSELMVLGGQYFMATDLRDKVYALIGLASDGQDFLKHVSYAPEETHITTFTRFAGLLVQKGYGDDLLRPAGLSGSEERDRELPSWIPNWADTSPRVNPSKDMIFTAQAGPTRTAMMRVIDNIKLSARGIIADTIKETSEMMFPVSPSQDLMDWIFAFVKAGMLIRKSLPNVDEIDIIFELFIQRKSPDFDEEELPRLQTGLTAFYQEMSSIKKALSLRDQLREGQSIMLPRIESAQECLFFKERANRATAGTRFCITEGGYCGLAPEKVAVGDQVLVLDGSAAAFVVRDIGKEDGSNVLIGSSYFHGLGEEERLTSEVSRDIILI